MFAMTTDCVTFQLAYVDAPEFEAIKVKAVLSEQHLTVQDLRGKMVLELDGVERIEDPDSGGRRFYYGEGDQRVVVQEVGGCRCGGSAVTPRVRPSLV